VTKSERAFYPMFQQQRQKPMLRDLPDIAKMTSQQVTAEIKARVALLQQAGELPCTEAVVLVDRQRIQHDSYAQSKGRIERKKLEVETTSYIPPVRADERSTLFPKRKSAPMGTLGSRNREFFEKLKHKQKG